MNKAYIFIFFLTYVLSGCATKSADFSVIEPVLGKGALVYIYRPNSMSNILISPDVLIDGDKRFKVKSNEYMAMYLPAGNHKFSLDLTKRYDGNHLVELILVDGKIYFLRIDAKMKFQMNAKYKRRFDILNVPQNKALKEIAHCRDLGKKQNKSSQSAQAIVEDGLGSTKVGARNASILADEPDAKFSISKTKNPFSKSK